MSQGPAALPQLNGKEAALSVGEKVRNAVQKPGKWGKKTSRSLVLVRLTLSDSMSGALGDSCRILGRSGRGGSAGKRELQRGAGANALIPCRINSALCQRRLLPAREKLPSKTQAGAKSSPEVAPWLLKEGEKGDEAG